MPSSAFFTWLDRSREKASMSFRTTTLAADGANYVTIDGQLDALQSALEAVTEGVIVERAFVGDRTRFTNVTPTLGKREQKWLVRFEDASDLRVYTLEIPCADDTTMPFATDSDFVDMNAVSATRDALISAIEGAVHAINGQAVNVLSIEAVGRNT